MSRFSQPRWMLMGLLFLAPTVVGAQDRLIQRQELSLHWGSLRTPYSVVQSGFDYRVLGGGPAKNWELEVHNESFGTFWTVGSPSFDLDAAILFQGQGPIEGTRVAAGAGALWEARLAPDERSAARTGGAPLIRFLISGQFPLGLPGLQWGTRLPIELDVYRNGVALACEPELQLIYGWAFVAVHEKNRLLWGGNAGGTEFRWDTNLALGAVYEP